jgi:uncharacterized metal-binding protein YceD (DUF177 family)
VNEKNDYILNFKDLSDGKHTFEFKLNDSFFAQFEDIDIEKGDIDVKIIAEKRNSSINLTFEINGNVSIICNRCLDNMILPVKTQNDVLAQFGQNFSQDDDILIIDEKYENLDIAWLLYEFIAVSLPIQRVHPDGQCDVEMMKLFDRYVVTNEKQ